MFDFTFVGCDNTGMSHTQRIDFVSDNNPSVFSYLIDNDMVPDYVLESRPVTQEECDGLDKVAFADQYNRLFPCHTKEACWQSAAYTAGKFITDDSLRSSIVKAASLHGIEDDVKTLFDHFQEAMDKRASEEQQEPMQKYALVIDFQGEHGKQKEGFYPVNGADEVYASAIKLDQDYHRGFMPIAQMRKVAFAVVEAAEETNLPLAELPDTVLRFGENRLPDADTARLTIGCRKKANVDMKPYNILMEGLCEEMNKAATHTEGIAIAEKIASALVQLDQKNHIIYSASQPDPFELIFTGPTVSDMRKAAAQCVTIAGIELPSVDFLNIADTTVDRTFSAREAGVIKAAKEVLSGTPSIEKRAAAEEKLLTLGDESAKVLLTVAANTGW